MRVVVTELHVIDQCQALSTISLMQIFDFFNFALSPSLSFAEHTITTEINLLITRFRRNVQNASGSLKYKFIFGNVVSRIFRQKIRQIRFADRYHNVTTLQYEGPNRVHF